MVPPSAVGWLDRRSIAAIPRDGALLVRAGGSSGLDRPLAAATAACSRSVMDLRVSFTKKLRFCTVLPRLSHLDAALEAAALEASARSSEFDFLRKSASDVVTTFEQLSARLTFRGGAQLVEDTAHPRAKLGAPTRGVAGGTIQGLAAEQY